MDRPVLYSLVERLRAEERLQGLAAALPTRARVSEPVLPLVLAALHDELERGLVVLLPEDADARDAAEAVGWFLGEEQVALFPSRGVHWGSGLEPPPHLVGERARALVVLERGGLVCASATAVAEGIPPVADRPALLRVAPGDEPGIDALAEQLASAGYERVERVEERGQFAVRGGLVDVFATTGREPLRIELFGDEIEQIRAFSPFTQRALRTVDEATIYPAAERRRELVEIDLGPDDGEEVALAAPGDLVQSFDRPPDFVWSVDEVRAVWSEERLTPVALDGATELTPLPQGQPHSFDAQRPALAARGLSEAENELGGLLRQQLDVVVAFPHRGEALRQQALLRRVQAGLLDPGQSPSGLQFAVSPARRGFVWRELGFALLPDTQVFRKRPPRAASAPGRALQSFSDLRTGDYVVHEDHGIAQLLGFETKEVAGVTRDYLLLAFRGDDRVYVPHEQIGKV
ncbi:MAG TPA: CarD family transcriptional regulator, partial [Gaiellaceae bacterium]|nr:CarD family transcriptional regulator [Gaiellaceae bacterium]